MSGFLVGGFSSAAISRAKCLAAVAQRFEGRPRRVRAVRQEGGASYTLGENGRGEPGESRSSFSPNPGCSKPARARGGKEKTRRSAEVGSKKFVHTLRLLGIMLAFPFVGLHIFKEVEKKLMSHEFGPQGEAWLKEMSNRADPLSPASLQTFRVHIKRLSKFIPADTPFEHNPQRICS